MEKDEAIRKVAIEVSRKLVDDGKIIEAGWLSYKLIVLKNRNLTRAQLDESRTAFFAGAQHLWGSIFSALDEDKEPTPSDEKRMSQINDELDKFVEELKKRI